MNTSFYLYGTNMLLPHMHGILIDPVQIQACGDRFFLIRMLFSASREIMYKCSDSYLCRKLIHVYFWLSVSVYIFILNILLQYIQCSNFACLFSFTTQSKRSVGGVI